jgi:hypothetical protein
MRAESKKEADADAEGAIDRNENAKVMSWKVEAMGKSHGPWGARKEEQACAPSPRGT